MGEPKTATEPRTRSSLAEDLRRILPPSGATEGGTPSVLLVHGSLSSLDWVVGGAVAVVGALVDAVGPKGTVVVPTQSGDNSDPVHWSRPPVPEAWWPTIRAEMPPYEPRITPTRGMGAIAEVLRTWPGAVRSPHPSTSFAAVGPRAAELMAVHDLDCALGARSPLAALEGAGASVLFIGTGWDTCTCFHLAEYRVPGLPRRRDGARVRTETGSAWTEFTDIDLDEGDFTDIGAAFEQTGCVTSGPIGSATGRRFDLGAAVHFATDWIGQHRPTTTTVP